MNFHQQVTSLKKRTFSPEHKVLTVYLNTESERSQQASWKLHLKNGLNRLAQYAKAEGAAEDVKSLGKLRKQLEKLLDQHKVDLKKSLVIVACPKEGILFLEKLQVSTPSAFYWETEPVLDNLESIIKAYPPAGVVLVGSDSVTVLDTVMGELEREWNYEWDMESEDWRQYQGHSGANGRVAGTNNKDRYDKRVEANRMGFMRRLGPILGRHKQRNNWQEIVIAGESTLTSELAKELGNSHSRVLHKNMNGMHSHQVLKEIFVPPGGTIH